MKNYDSPGMRLQPWRNNCFELEKRATITLGNDGAQGRRAVGAGPTRIESRKGVLLLAVYTILGLTPYALHVV